MKVAFKWMGQSEDGSTVTLKKFEESLLTKLFVSDEEWMQSNLDLVRTGIVLDVETTGLEKNQDKVIEIGIREFKFNRVTGKILSIGESFQGLEDPGRPLSEEIKTLTGLTDEILAGKKIDWPSVEQMISNAHIVIAHNASFDRPFIEKYVSIASTKIWGCSLKQIDWKIKGYPTKKLEILCIYHGFFIDAHRALNDADALLYLLSLSDPSVSAEVEKNDSPYLYELLSNARRPLVKVVASRAAFETKDLLKVRGYSWDQSNRSWHRSIYKENLNSEISWLEEKVYAGPFLGITREIPVTENFKH